MEEKIEEILSFWFVGYDSPYEYEYGMIGKWFSSDPSYNDEIRGRFGEDHRKASNGEYDNWAESPRGALALIILFDQFTRNLYPDTPENVSNDANAVRIARLAVDRGFDKQAWPLHKLFFYLPFEHAEDLDLQKLCIQKFDECIESETGKAKETFESFKSFAIMHYVVIEQYGRFPGRNQMLGRQNTPEEEEYLINNPDGF